MLAGTEEILSLQLQKRFAGWALATRCVLGKGLAASPVSCTEQPGCGGTGSGVQRWQGGSQVPAPFQGRAEEGLRRQDVQSPREGWQVLTLSPGLDYT